MKHLSFLFLCSLFTSVAFAQINKGQWLTGGNVLFSYDKSSYGSNYTTETKQLNSLINGGYFLLDKFAMGLNVNYNYSKANASNFSSLMTSSQSVIAGPFMRIYFLPVQSKVNLLLHASYQYGYNKQVYNGLYGEAQAKSKTHNIGASFGPAFVLNPNVTLELLAGYYYQKMVDSEVHSNAFLVGVGFQIHLGKGKQAN